MSKLFGTDGIRGTANSHPMTADIALKLGMAAGTYFNRGDHRHTAVIAKDTRLSGYMIEPAITSGLISTGMDVILVGPLPTPAVAMLVRAMRADLGIMISASHNQYADNGIKLFGPNGYKLSSGAETEIESLIAQPEKLRLAASGSLGRAKRLDDAPGRYIEFVKSTFPKSLTLDGLKIVLDCANGAAYQVGPTILQELGAKVYPLGVSPDGFNINEKCGSTSPAAMCEAVVRHGASLGIALDGDADRVIICDEKGMLLDGDQIIAMIATYWHGRGALREGGVVGTHMSNMGLEDHLRNLGLTLARTNIGDRYVIEHMHARGFNIGGEPSGHIILSDYSTTGDGLIAALQMLAVMLEDGRPLSQSGRMFTPYPQLLRNIPYRGRVSLESAGIASAVAQAKAALGQHGRVLIRPSGTEPVVRVMLEGRDAAQLEKLAAGICDAIAGAA